MVFCISFTGQDLEPQIRIRIRKPDPNPCGRDDQKVRMVAVLSFIFLKQVQVIQVYRKVVTSRKIKQKNICFWPFSLPSKNKC